MKTKELNTGSASVTAEGPIRVAFGMRKDKGVYVAYALKLQGNTVVGEKVLEQDDTIFVAYDAIDKGVHEYVKNGVDPFAPKKEE